MKKFYLLLVAILIATTSFAQQMLATLNHNDSITVYYGLDAFKQAHAAAVNGDIITLSSGTFNSTTITKAVTIRGAGGWADSLGSQTTIREETTINVPQDSVHNLVLEGIYTFQNVRVQNAYNPQFVKCRFEGAFHVGYNDNNNYYNMRQGLFVNCYLNYWTNAYNGHGGWCATGTQFINSVIVESYSYDSPDVFINCVVYQNPEQSYMLCRTFSNCVLSYNYVFSSCITNNSTSAINCMFIQTNESTATCGTLFSGHPGHTLWNARGWNTVFKGVNYELTDSIAANCLGTDGTQIGIYGGTMPFDPRVTNPIIKRISVAQRSTVDGKLPVDIEVVSEEE